MSESIYNQHRPSSSGGDYLKLKDGDKVKLRIASEPAISVYKEGDRPRYSWVVYNREEEKPQIYTAGISVYSQIADLVEEWGSPETFDIIVKRTGSGLQDTSYSVTPVKTSKDLTDTEKEEVEKVDLVAGIKGKWLSEYHEDGQPPAPIKQDVPEDDEPITEADIPPEYR